MGNPFITYSDEEQKSPASSRCPYGHYGAIEEALRNGHLRMRPGQPHPGSDLPLRHSAAGMGRSSGNPSRRMVETFVEVVRRGMREGENEVAVTYAAPSRSDADAGGADEDDADLPPLVPMRDGWGPDADSDEDADEEDLIQEYGLPAEPMDTSSSDDASHRSISEQQAFERQGITDNPEWAFQRRRSRATAERSRASLADYSARAAHAEMLAMLRREWERARAASATARANGAAQPENLSSVRRVAREVLAQLDSRIESLTARQRERPPAVDRPRMPAGPERFLEAASAQGTEGTTFAAVDIRSLLSNSRARHASTGTNIDPFLTHEEVRERGRLLLTQDGGTRMLRFVREPEAAASTGQLAGPSGGSSQADIFSRTSGAAQLL